MNLVYIDESGDDGYPSYSCPLFVLTACYFNEEWSQYNYDLIKKHRKDLKTKYNLPTGVEIHLRELMQLKKPYRGLGLSKSDRQNIIKDHFQFIASDELKVKFVNVLIDKPQIVYQGYSPLEKSVEFLIERIEMELNDTNPTDKRFLCISDKGRVEVMNKTARKIRKIRYVSSKTLGSRSNYPIQNHVEDILEKDSKASPFIQLCDCVSRMVNLYGLQHICRPSIKWSKKDLKFIKYGDERDYLKMISHKLHLRGSPNEFGIKHHPEKK
jgi:hypothetical protein